MTLPINAAENAHQAFSLSFLQGGYSFINENDTVSIMLRRSGITIPSAQVAAMVQADSLVLWTDGLIQDIQSDPDCQTFGTDQLISATLSRWLRWSIPQWTGGMLTKSKQPPSLQNQVFVYICFRPERRCFKASEAKPGW